MTARPPYSVLFLCTGNSARSILAEAILHRRGEGRFKAFSAGSSPKGTVNPHAIALLKKFDYPTADLRSKSWDEFADRPGAPGFDIVVTVCDNAAGEVCPFWPGRPVTTHWGLPDPADARGSDGEIEVAFMEAYKSLEQRIAGLIDLPLEDLDRTALKARLDEIGRSAPGCACPSTPRA